MTHKHPQPHSSTRTSMQDSASSSAHPHSPPSPPHSPPTGTASSRRPPRFRRGHRSSSSASSGDENASPSRTAEASHVTIYVSGAYKPPQNANVTSPDLAAAAGYGVYIDSGSPALRTRLSEPLHSRHQSERAATVAALAAALRMGHALPTTSVHIIVDDKDVADHYNSHAHSWRDRVRAKLADKIWHPVAALVGDYHNEATVLHVSSEKHSTCSPLRKARDLAYQAMGKHAFCRLCRRNYGRPGALHDCHPICFTPPCRGERFDNLLEFERHMEERHPINVVYPEDGQFLVGKAKRNHTSSDESSDTITVFTCPSCKKPFVDLAAFEEHVESKCPDALAHWFSQTKIVKS